MRTGNLYRALYCDLNKSYCCTGRVVRYKTADIKKRNTIRFSYNGFIEQNRGHKKKFPLRNDSRDDY